MRFLFYIVHPAKFYLFRNTINALQQNHHIDIIINSKDVLENLIKMEKWEYFNIFPKGRNVSNKPSIVKSAFNFLLTIYKLEKFLLGKEKYDLFITDDALVVNGWFHKIKTYIFNDNDIETIKIIKILFFFTDIIISPKSTKLGQFEYKKIAFRGNKALAHLHPKYFTPSYELLQKYNLQENQYCIIRIAKLNATHDINSNTGISDKDIEKIINLIGKRYQIIIVHERQLSYKFENFVFKGNPYDIPTLLYYSKFLISDSGTMATEAAILGIPNILINKLAKKIGVHKELKNVHLQYYYDNFSQSLTELKEFIFSQDIKEEWNNRRDNYIENCDDLNQLFLNEFTTL